MKRTGRSSTVAAVVLACAAGLLGAGTASAAEYPFTPADPRALPGGCVTSGELPWVGNTDVSLSVRVDGESATEGMAEARFRLWRADAGATPVLDLPVSASPGTTATLRVPKSYVPETGPYWWQARIESASGASAWTTPCGFSTDHTRPAPAGVAFLDLDAYPNGAPAGTVRTVRLSVPEGTEAAYFCLDPFQPPVDCEGEERIPVGADGTATTTFAAPERSGPSTAWARAFDRAGNLSDAGSASYWVTSPAPQPFGDYDGDGRSDLLAVDAAGRLTRLAGQEGGGFAAPVAADARDWTGARVARAGWLINRYGPQEANDPRNDLVAQRGGRMYAYPGDGSGGFGQPVEITGYDWSRVTSFALTREDYATPRIVAVEDDRLLFFELFTGRDGMRVTEPHVLASQGWAAKELLTSDASRATLLGSFWARDARQGTLEYAGVDHGLDRPYDLVAPVRVAASGWSGRQLPGVVAVGDLDGDERIDLVTADRWGRLAVRVVGADGAPGAPAAVAGSVPGGARPF
ncbi:hypothetical protein [Streptomyces roseolus]